MTKQPVRPVDIVAENKARDKILKQSVELRIKDQEMLANDTILSSLTPQDLASTKEALNKLQEYDDSISEPLLSMSGKELPGRIIR